jgi:hypothetical protein
MFDVVLRQWGSDGSSYFVHRGILDEPRLARTLTKQSESGQPVMLLGTTLAFLKFFDYIQKTQSRWTLPNGSLLLDTGGMKTQQREVTRGHFVASVEKVLGIPAERCMNEYGMAELSSQFYGRGASQKLQGPPWVRTLAMDMVTGLPCPQGQSGLLRHFDLANVDSVMAIQTEDLGSPLSAMLGDPYFEFKGRAPQSELKGCSLTMEAALHQGQK